MYLHNIKSLPVNHLCYTIVEQSFMEVEISRHNTSVIIGEFWKI
jgi:hypothetical protein